MGCAQGDQPPKRRDNVGVQVLLSSLGRIAFDCRGVVFAGDTDGNFIALDARTGKDLWHFQTGSPIFASPMTYALGGKQYIVIPSGTALLAFALPDGAAGD